MSIQRILTDPALQPLLFIPVVTLVLGIFGAVITQIILEGRQRHVITFSQKKEIPLTLAKDELKEKLQIEYQGSKIDTLYYFHLKIANTGKKMIEKQILTCSLHSIISILSIHSIDFRESHPVEVAGTGNTAIIGDSANITIHQRPQTDET